MIFQVGPLSSSLRLPRPVGTLAWTLGVVAMHAAVPFQLSQLDRRAGRRTSTPAVRGAGLVLVAAGTALMGWAFAGHYRAAEEGWQLRPWPAPGYLLRGGPYRLSRNPMYAGEAVAWAGWGLVYASPAVWAGLAGLCAAFTVITRWEEQQLLRRFGEPYRAYPAEVPRWVPRGWTPPAPGGSRGR
ncbi:MAG TPA: isoprenylcysteine carboxylmethyltransferase family protein [Streptosporangiaceae bacterium]